MIRYAVPARVGILGNPSDGYEGRTLALAIPQFSAVVTVEEADGVELLPGPADHPAWPSVAAMVEHIDLYGYGTGPQVLAAATRAFIDVAGSLDRSVAWGFRIGYETTIPRQVGLGGSSALVLGVLRGLCELHRIEIPEQVLPSIALQAETTQLGITAGLQDRVVQTYGGLVAMDFGQLTLDTRFGVRHGHYERLDPSMLPPLFLAYQTSGAEPSDGYHHQLRARYESGDPVVRDTLRELAGLVLEGRAALRWGDHNRFARLIGRNMALRSSLAPLPDHQLELVEVAAGQGAPATFAGSGGAVVGALTDDDQAEALAAAFAEVGAEFLSLCPPPDGASGMAEGIGGGATDNDEAPTNVVTLDRARHP
jgi:glucuronokinase